MTDYKIMKTIKTIIFSIILTSALFTVVAPLTVQAVTKDTQAEIQRQMGAAGEKSGLGTPTDPRIIAANIIRTILGLLGIIFFALTVYAGYLWMTAGGEDEKVTKAKSLLMQAVIGLAIILSAYGITLFATRLAMGDYDKPYWESELLGPDWLERIWVAPAGGGD